MFSFTYSQKFSTREAILDLLAKTGRGMRLREIAQNLNINASTVSRRMRDLREEHWVITTAELQGLPVTGDERDLHMTLNPDRPGLQEYLTWMHIEHGTDDESFWQFIEELRSSRPTFRPYQPPTPEVDPKDESTSSTVRRLLPNFSQAPIPAPYYRALIAPVAEVLNWPGYTQGTFQSLYKTEAGASERYRDFIHLMIHVHDNLRGVPSIGDERDARPELAELAVVARHNALVLSERAQVLYEAAVLGRHRDLNLIKLAGWARNQIFPGAEPESWIRGGAELQAAERVRHIYAQLEGRSDSGWKYYKIGGTPGLDDVGGAGDGLLAQMMLDQAHRCEETVEKIAELPGMAEVLNTPEVAAHMSEEVPSEFTSIEVAGHDVRVEFFSHRQRSHDTEEHTAATSTQQQKVAGQDLQVNDRIMAIEDRELLQPLDVVKFPEPGKVTLAQDIYEITVTTTGLFDNKTVTVSRLMRN